MSKITPNFDYNVDDVAQILDKKEIENNIYDHKYGILNRSITIGSIILFLGSPILSNANIIRKSEEKNIIRTIEKYIIQNDYALSELSSIFEDNSPDKEFDLVYFNLIQKETLKQVSLDEDFMNALNTVTYKTGKEKPSKSRF